MNRNKSKQQDDLHGTTTTFTEDGQEEHESDDAPDASVLVKTNRRGAYITDMNPFIFATVRDMQTRQKRLTLKRGTPVTVASPDGVGTQVFTTLEQTKPIDRKTFVKVFSGPIFRDVFNLSVPGLKMYLVVLDILGDVSSINKVYIRLTTAQAINLTAKSDKPLSKTTVDRGIKNLIDQGYISGAEINGEREGWYWINPAYFFNGDTVVIKQTLTLDRQVSGAKLRGETSTVKRPDVPAETLYRAMETQAAMSAGKHWIVEEMDADEGSE